MDNNQHLSNTQEINAILNEAKQYNQNNQTIENISNTAPIDLDNNEYGDIYHYKELEENEKDRMKKNKNKRKNKNNKKKKIILICAGVLLLIIIAFLIWYFFLSASHNKFAKNIYVDDVSIAGMTMEEAKKELKSHEDKLADSIKIDVSAENSKTTLSKDDFTYTFNTDEILNEAMEYSEEKGFKTEDKKYTIKLTFDKEGCDKASQKVADELNCEPKNAEVTSWSTSELTFEIEDEKSGIKIDDKDLSAKLKEFNGSDKLSGEIKATCESIKPKYTKDYLSKNITKMSSFTTTSTNSSAGNHNMATALDACNGSIINPGETWSFNDCTGDSNKTSNGYEEAGVIIEGRHETGVGGGICQSSTTIYNAGLLGGLDVEERSCHYYKSSYVDAGRDATVDYGNLDLKMSNPNDYQILLKCYMDGVTLYAEIYSVPNENWDEIEVSSEVTSHFDNGYRASTSRTFYKNGSAVSTEELPSSTYYTSEPKGNTDDVNSYDNGGQDEDSGDSGSGSSGTEEQSSEDTDEETPPDTPIEENANAQTPQ